MALLWFFRKQSGNAGCKVFLILLLKKRQNPLASFLVFQILFYLYIIACCQLHIICQTIRFFVGILFRIMQQFKQYLFSYLWLWTIQKKPCSGSPWSTVIGIAASLSNQWNQFRRFIQHLIFLQHPCNQTHPCRDVWLAHNHLIPRENTRREFQSFLRNPP